MPPHPMPVLPRTSNNFSCALHFPLAPTMIHRPQCSPHRHPCRKTRRALTVKNFGSLAIRSRAAQIRIQGDRRRVDDIPANSSCRATRVCFSGSDLTSRSSPLTKIARVALFRATACICTPAGRGGRPRPVNLREAGADSNGHEPRGRTHIWLRSDLADGSAIPHAPSRDAHTIGEEASIARPRLLRITSQIMSPTLSSVR